MYSDALLLLFKADRGNKYKKHVDFVYACTVYCQQGVNSVWPFAVIYNTARNIEELELTTSPGLFDMLPYNKLQLRKWAESPQLQPFIILHIAN